MSLQVLLILNWSRLAIRNIDFYIYINSKTLIGTDFLVTYISEMIYFLTPRPLVQCKAVTTNLNKITLSYNPINGMWSLIRNITFMPDDSKL